MGKIYAKLFAKQPVRLLFLGLDAAGKTTTLYKLKLGEVVTAIPTIGFNVETIHHDKVEIAAWDVGSRDKMRALLRHYYAGTDGVVCVVDSADAERLDTVKHEIHSAAAEDHLQGVPILVLANKQDLTTALSTQALQDQLQLCKLAKNTKWYIAAASAYNGQGLWEGLDWITREMACRKATDTADQCRDSAAKRVAGVKGGVG